MVGPLYLSNTVKMVQIKAIKRRFNASKLECKQSLQLAMPAASQCECKYYFKHYYALCLSQTQLHSMLTCNSSIRSLQFADTLVAVWHSVSGAGRSQFMRNGMFDCHSIHDAAICHCIDSVFPMAHE